MSKHKHKLLTCLLFYSRINQILSRSNNLLRKHFNKACFIPQTFHSRRGINSLHIHELSHWKEKTITDPTHFVTTTKLNNADLNKSDLLTEHGFLLQNSKALPEKRSLKRSRDEDRIRNRYERQAERVYAGRKQLNEEGFGEKIEQTNQRKNRRLQNFQTAYHKKKRTGWIDHNSFLHDMVKSLQSSKSIQQMKDIIENSRMSSKDETYVIRLLGSRRAYEPMLYLLNNSFHGPNVRSYTAAIGALAHSTSMRDRKQALILLDNMSKNGVVPNSFTFTAAFLAVDGPIKAKEMMSRMDAISKQITQSTLTTQNSDSLGNQDNIDPIHNVFTFNSAIHSCSRGNFANGFKTAYDFYQNMKERNISPDEKTLTSLLHCATKSISATPRPQEKRKIMRDALDILHIMRSKQQIQPSSKAWGAALSVCAAAGSYNEAKEVFQTMEEVGCTKNIIHYNQYFSALAKAGKDEMVWEEFERMQSNSKVLPEIVTLNTVLGAFARTGNYDRAVELLSRMKQGEFGSEEEANASSLRANGLENRLSPDTISYNSVLSACSDSKEAWRLVKEMRLSRRNRSNLTTPTVVTYTNAITACRKSNPPDLETAKRLFQVATETDAIIPNVFMYSALIWTAERCKDSNEAFNILKEMKLKRCKPNVVSYDGVISAFTSEVLQQDVDFASSLKTLETLVEIYEVMKEDGVTPTALTFQKLALSINHCFSTGNFDVDNEIEIDTKISLLERIFSKMRKHEARLGVGGPIIKSLILAYATSKRYDDAKRVFESIVGEKDVQATSAMLFACSKAVPARWEEAISLVKEYIGKLQGTDERKNVDPMLLNYAVIACSKQNKWSEALDLMEEHYSCPINSQNASSKDTKTTISVAALNALTASCGRCGHPEVAVTILNNMPIKYGVNPDERSYRSVIMACNQAEHERQRHKYASHKNFNEDEDIFELQWWECALSLFRRMQEENLSPDVQTYSSIISCCQAAGQWQRAIGVLQAMIKDIERKKSLPTESSLSLNLFCLNAAIAACEKGGAWIEALSLYELIKSNEKIQPNFVTVNSVLIALDDAGQKELAGTIYKEAIRNGILSPWKYRYVNETRETNDKIKVLDLHQFSVPMAKIAVLNVMESLLEANPVHDKNNDLVIVVGKGKGSEPMKGPVLLPVIMKLLKTEYAVDAIIDESNPGRIRIQSEVLYEFISERAWRSWFELEEDSV